MKIFFFFGHCFIKSLGLRRSEIKALLKDKALPSFITIQPHCPTEADYALGTGKTKVE